MQIHITSFSTYFSHFKTQIINLTLQQPMKLKVLLECDKRPLDRNEKLSGLLKSTHKKWFLIYWNLRSYRFFSNFPHKLSSSSSINPESFIVKCLTRFPDNQCYLKWSALHHHCCGNSCCLETKKHKIWSWVEKVVLAFMTEIEALSFPCEIFIWKDPPQCQKNCCEPP